MTKNVVIVLLVVLGGVVGWLHWSPRSVDRRLGEAVLATDTATIRRLVNFPKVRDQLLADIQAARNRAARDGRTPNMDSLAQATPQIAWSLMMPRSQSAEWASTPEGFGTIVNLAYWALKDEPKPGSLSAGFVDFPAIFEVVKLLPGQPLADTARLVFRRNGLKWQVEQVRLYGLCRSACR